MAESRLRVSGIMMDDIDLVPNLKVTEVKIWRKEICEWHIDTLDTQLKCICYMSMAHRPSYTNWIEACFYILFERNKNSNMTRNGDFWGLKIGFVQFIAVI